MVKWSIDDFKTEDEINAEISRLESCKKEHLEKDDMPSFYFENIDTHLKQLYEKKNQQLTESRLPSDPDKDPQFGVPEQKKYPLFDKKHVESAIKLFGHVEPMYERQLARAIISKMKVYGIPYDIIGKDNRLYRYLPESFKNK